MTIHVSSLSVTDNNIFSYIVYHVDHVMPNSWTLGEFLKCQVALHGRSEDLNLIGTQWKTETTKSV